MAYSQKHYLVFAAVAALNGLFLYGLPGMIFGLFAGALILAAIAFGTSLAVSVKKSADQNSPASARRYRS